MTFTNVADEREYWTLHPGLASTIRWRVRAVRRTANPSLPSGIAITPLVTWKPAIGAQSYEIELSRHLYPWSPVRKQTSLVTSTVLPLGKPDHGTWYYRVRGVNPNLPANAQKMTWSQPVAITITGNLIAVLG